MLFIIAVVSRKETVKTGAEKGYNSILTEALRSQLQNSGSESVHQVCLVFKCLSSEEVEAEVFQRTGINRSLLSETGREYSAEEINTYIITERQVYAELQMKRHCEFLNAFPDIRDLIQNSNSEENYYCSKLAPFIYVALTETQIVSLLEYENLVLIDVVPDAEPVSPLNSCIETVRADYVRDSLYYKGGGIKIGMTMFNGYPSSVDGLFNESYFYRDPNGAASATDAHGTLTAYPIVGQAVISGGIAYEGIVPNASMHTSTVSTIANWVDRMEWLLLERQVNVINLSMGWLTGCYYSSIDGWIEHIGINHSVHIIVSAGNSNGAISPAFAYNVITVGAVRETSSDGTLAGYHSWFSQYWADGIYNTTVFSKPDICAPGEDIYIPTIGSVSGTSLSAPIVAAIVAEACQANSGLLEKQATMKAILAASIHHPLALQDSDNEFQMMGAGMVDAYASFYTASNGNWISGNFPAGTAQGSTATYSFSVSSTDLPVRVALSWLKNTNIQSGGGWTNPTVSGLKLTVLDPNGVEIRSSTKMNLSVISFLPTITGNYTIKITFLAGDTSQTTYYGAAWW
ncbi:MAG: S8/S53 family peptidase [Lachnospiraceae bacterium]|nr:S8/S53 family peptidase [Lachnospiraceae bacterium]